MTITRNTLERTELRNDCGNFVVLLDIGKIFCVFRMSKGFLSTRRLVNRFMTSFTTQIARRGFRAMGVPNSVIPFLAGIVRRINYQIQWSNSALWKQRTEEARNLYREFLKERHEVSPVYRFRGPSETVRRASGDRTGRIQPVPVVNAQVKEPSSRFEKLRHKLDSSTLVLGGLGFVIVTSMGGPMLAKKMNWVDPLDAASSRLDNFSLK